jgi:hypothetical protein
VSTKSGESLPLSIDEMKTAVDHISGGTPTLETVTKSYTPTESQQTETITPSSGYDGIGEVDVTVGAISSTYVGSGITRQSSLNVYTDEVVAPAGYYAESVDLYIPLADNNVTASFNSATGLITATDVVSENPNNPGLSMYTANLTTITDTLQLPVKTSSDMEASGATVTAPSGWYASDATKTVPSMTLPTSASSSGSGTRKATIASSNSTQYINIPTGYNSAAAYYQLSAPAAMTLPTTTSSTSSGTLKTTVTPGTANKYINIPTGNNTAAAYYTVSGDSNLVAGNIKSGTSIFGVTGSYTGGGGGTSKNVQISQTPGRATTSTYTAVGPSITVSKTGTYSVYWTGYRSSTSGTNGTQLCIGTVSYGQAQTTFKSDSGLTNIQEVHLSGVSLSQNDVLTIKARSRGNNYYMYVLDLVIIEE